MHPTISRFWRIMIGVLAVALLVACIYFFIVLEQAGAKSLTETYIEKKLSREQETYNKLHFNLVGPESAPESLQSLAKLGFEIMINTPKNAHDYVGDHLSCTNCHIAGGNTTGGAQGGISLVGVATKFPSYDKGEKKVIDLPARINACFRHSMNGKPLPLDSELMLALITYFQWISQGLPIYGPVPWLGLNRLSTDHIGNIDEGKRVYRVYCAICHRDDGLGGENIPPLWGDNSFNDRAGMNHISTLAAFTYWNMPYSAASPILSEEQAIDVAAYIISQPRPHEKKEKERRDTPTL